VSIPVLLLAPALVLGAPVFSVERGLKDAPFTLTIEAEDGGDLLYSVDGSVPTLPWPGGLEITGTTSVRASESVVQGDPDVVTHTYIFLADVLQQPTLDPAIVGDPVLGAVVEDTLRTMPTVSLVNPTGLGEDERPVSFEWIPPDGETLQEDCGAAKVGGASIRYAKNNIRLYFRSQYGVGRLHADLYEGYESGLEPVVRHDSLNLRGGSHDSVFWLEEQGQYLRNRWMDESQLAMGHIAPHGRYAHMYLNGQYRGLHQVRERFGAAFLSEYMGGEEEDYEAVNHGRTMDGSGAAWQQVIVEARRWEEVQRWLNVENFIDYMLLQFYAGNDWDWRHNHNWMAAGPATPDRGGYVFHSSDSDVCLVYDYTVNILSNSGPSHVFESLLSAAHPDFMTMLADRIQVLLVDEGGPLTAAACGDRYQAASEQVEDAIVAEYARWGGGAFDRDVDWVGERARLLNDFFPLRTDELLRQVREVGWFPLEAPTVDRAGGTLPEAATVTVTAPTDADVLWVRVDGGDPREPGGGISPSAVSAVGSQDVDVEYTTRLRARARLGDAWGAALDVEYLVPTPAPIVLNEWNAVGEEGVLADGDPALGAVPGNGGDWLELVVVEDHLDLRGWSLQAQDREGPAGTLRFRNDDRFADLRRGTIITIAEDLPEDPGYDPVRGDWRLHLRASEAPDALLQGTFDTTHRGWTLRVSDAEGRTRFGPAGEDGGISSVEVGMLAAQPGIGTGADSDYRDADGSTFAAPNRWPGGAQNFAALRPDVAPPPPVDVPPGASCGGESGVLVGFLLLLPLARRRPELLLCAVVPLTLTACPSADGEAPSDCPDAEVCDGLDNDCDGLIDDADPDLVDGLPFFVDRDGDGWGGGDVATACAAGDHALRGGDCDDDDPAMNPGAQEQCDGVDRDCDGSAGDAVGLTENCAASSCLEILTAERTSEDGAYWIALRDSAAPVWCDMARGGWMLGFVRNSVDVGDQGTFGAGEVAIDHLRDSPGQAANASFPRRGWLDLNLMEWTELRVGAYYVNNETYLSSAIPRELLRIEFGEPGYFLYGEAGYYWCGGPASYTDAGVGAVNNPPGAPADCRGHGSLGSGWDFSEVGGANQGLTLCGGDASAWLYAAWADQRVYYGNPGGAQAIWVR